MPVLSCPKCPTKLKVPDGVSGNTRCPKCGTVFPVVKPAFEVADEPKKTAPKPATKAAPPPPPPAKPQPAFELADDEPKKKRVVDDDEDDEEEERPRKKKPSRDDDDDDDDDRPRSRKRRRRDDDDDDDDDRPRKKKGSGKKKRYYDDEDDDNWRPRGGGSGEFAKAKTGALLIGLSYWMNLAAYGILALYVLIAWLMVAGASESSSSSSRGRSSSSGSGSGEGVGEFLDVIVILPGLIGLCAWLIGLIGCSFAIAGPRKARGMAITATVFAAVHLLLVGVTFSNLQDGIGGVGRELPGVGKVAWIAVASLLPAVDTFLPTLFYQSKSIGGDYVIALLAGVAEGGRLIFGLLALKALAAAAKDYDASERSGYGMMIVIGVIGGVVVLTLLVAVLLAEGKFKSLNTYLNLGLGTLFLMYLAYALMMLSPAIAAFGTKDACARRA